MRKLLVFAVSLILLILGIRASAQWSNDPSVNTPICTTYANQLNPQIVFVGDGWIIAWEDDRYDAWRDIFAQKLSLDGHILWDPAGVPICVAPKIQRLGGLTSDGEGGAIIVWSDARDNPFEPYPYPIDIYAQRIDSTGNVRWQVNGMPICTAEEQQNGPVVCSDGEGGAIIAWMDERGFLLDVYAQRISHDGEILWDSNGVVVQPDSICTPGPKIVSDTKGGAILRFCSWVQRIDGNGNSLWGSEGILPLSLSAGIYDIDKDGLGGIVLALVRWLASSNEYYIYVQRIDSSGNRLWGDEGVLVSKYAGRQTVPRIVSDGAGGAIVSWVAQDPGEFGQLYVQRIDSNGTAVWTTNGVSVEDSCTQLIFGMVTDNCGGADIYYTVDGKKYLYAQRINENGEFLWGDEGVMLSSRDFEPVPSLEINWGATDGDGGLLVVWYELGDCFDIYGQWIDKYGNLGGVGVEERQGAGCKKQDARLLEIYPNPFHKSVVINYLLSRQDFVSLKVYDVSGSEVKTLVSREQGAGEYKLRWDGKNYQGKEVKNGVYLLRLVVGPYKRTSKMVFIGN